MQQHIAAGTGSLAGGGPPDVDTVVNLGFRGKVIN